MTLETGIWCWSVTIAEEGVEAIKLLKDWSGVDAFGVNVVRLALLFLMASSLFISLGFLLARADEEATDTSVYSDQVEVYPAPEERPIVVVVTPEPTETKAGPGQATEIIPEEAIKHIDAATVADAIQYALGMQPSSYGPVGNLDLPHLRGFTPDQALVRIDGVPINPSGGGRC